MAKTIVRWTEEELEEADRLYDQEYELSFIAESLNEEFHDGKPVRTVNSVSKKLSRYYENC